MTKESTVELAPDAPVERIYYDEVLAFERVVMSMAKGLCSNCGSDDRVRVRMVVPSEAGGVLVASNGVALCRTCDMARDSVPEEKGKKDGTVVSVWMSQRLREKIDNHLKPKKSFRSWSALSRYLISKYVADEHRFDDLEQYQDSGSDTKVTIRADKEIYSTFSAMLKKRGMTVTDALKGLYLMYASGAGVVVNGR
jgi:hypothetical protein